MVNSDVESLKRLPQHQDEIWEGGLIQLPDWLAEEERDARNPALALWVSRKTGEVYTSEVGQWDPQDVQAILQTLVEFATDRDRAGYRPGRLEVNDPDLAEDLSRLLEDADIEVIHSTHMDAFQDFVDEASDEMLDNVYVPGLLTGEGVTIERVRGFADAAAAFYHARLWEELTDEDLIQIESPEPPENMGFAVVLGAGGFLYGLGFYDSVDEYWDYRAAEESDTSLENSDDIWTLTYDRLVDFPFDDVSLWGEHSLPVADRGAYPTPVCHTPAGDLIRPDGETLLFLEGLLRALTDTRETELDSGRWTKDVRTSAGPRTYTLSLPFLLDPPDSSSTAMQRGEGSLAGIRREDLDELADVISREFGDERPSRKGERQEMLPREQAQDICYEAFEAFGRRRKLLARRALSIDPDCADAYVLLADEASTLTGAIELYRRGVSAGRRTLGPQTFRKKAGNFWTDKSTRPYMRALFGLADALHRAGRPAEAVEHYRQLIRLNPKDNQGVRHYLLPALIETGEDEAAADLLEQYRGERDTTWLYCRALLAYRRYGDGPEATEALSEALWANEYVPDYLLGVLEPPAPPVSVEPGTEEEAILVAQECGHAWEATPGALPWLYGEVEE